MSSDFLFASFHQGPKTYPGAALVGEGEVEGGITNKSDPALVV